MVQESPGSVDPPLRILLAHDLSAAAELGLGLILHAPWPASTIVRVMSSPTGIGPGLSSFANLDEARANTQQVRQAIRSTHERVAADLREAGLQAEVRTVPGKPERAILAEADRFGADLIVMGAQRQGSLTATLLGSVSRAVLERAPCSVLVARCTTARRLLLATDGSAPATFATDIVAAWPLFATSQILLVGVGEAPSRYAGVVLSEAERRAVYGEAEAAAIDETASIVRDAVDLLAGRGRSARSQVRLGDVGPEVVAAAAEWPADMVVIGLRAKPLLHRLVLGTAARTILDGVASSVLVARPRTASDGGPEAGPEGSPA